MSDTLELRQPVETGDDEGLHTPPPPFEGVKWRIKIADKEYGPYPRTRLIDFLKEGRVQAGTCIACGTDTEYHRADHHPNLRWDFKGPKKRKFGDPRLDSGETEVPVCNYFIAARLLSGNERFERVLHEAGKMTTSSSSTPRRTGSPGTISASRTTSPSAASGTRTKCSRRQSPAVLTDTSLSLNPYRVAFASMRCPVSALNGPA